MASPNPNGPSHGPSNRARREIRLAAEPVASLSAPVGGTPDESHPQFQDLIEDPSAAGEQEAAVSPDWEEPLRRAIARLPETERRGRSACGGRGAPDGPGGQPPKPMGLREVGEALGVSSERVRQVQFKALATVRESPHAATLVAAAAAV